LRKKAASFFVLYYIFIEKINISNFVLSWVLTPCKVVGRYQRFGGILSPFSGLKTMNMETWYFSETLISTYESTRLHNPELQISVMSFGSFIVSDGIFIDLHIFYRNPLNRFLLNFVLKVFTKRSHVILIWTWQPCGIITSVYCSKIRSEGCNHHTHCPEVLKSHRFYFWSVFVGCAGRTASSFSYAPSQRLFAVFPSPNGTAAKYPHCILNEARIEVYQYQLSIQTVVRNIKYRLL
jgi:hypothetical protein